MLLDPGMYGLRRGTPEFNAFADELLQEARLLQSLRHPNVVLFHGVTMHPEHGHVQWLVTERADGGSLETWLSHRGRLTLEELLDLLRSVMRALVYLHSRTPAVLHRDIKPANVLVFMIFGGGIVWKLGDVGIAKVLQSTQHARTGAGTPLYTALDVHMGPYDGKVDVFSTGIMAAELVVRHVDIAGFERAAATQFRYPDQRLSLVEDACTRLDTVSPSLSAVVRGCSAMKAKHRMTSEAALRALQHVDVGGGAAGGGAAAAAAAAAAATATVAAAATATATVAAVGGSSGGGGIGSGGVYSAEVGSSPAAVGTAVTITSVATPSSSPAASQVVDMSEALTAMEALQVPSEVSDRVCEAMVTAAAEAGAVTGARFLQMVVDEGVKPAVAMKLRQRLGIAAVVPPRTVRRASLAACRRAEVNSGGTGLTAVVGL
jgi:hypothetical protein